jgi:methylaspartate mutase S subunit
MEKQKKTLVIGVIGADVHAVGNQILYHAFSDAGFNVINLGVMVSQEEFINAAIETNADAIVVSSLYGQGELDCRGLREKCDEAGLEHISRGTLPHVDTLLLVSDCSRRGIQAAARIAEMVEQLELKPGQMKLIVNRAPDGKLSDGVKEEIEKHGLELTGVLPQDSLVYEYDCDGKPSAKVPEDAPIKQALYSIMAQLGL